MERDIQDQEEDHSEYSEEYTDEEYSEEEEDEDDEEQNNDNDATVLSLRLRKNEASLSMNERRQFVDALKRMKASGRYDYYVRVHVELEEKTSANKMNPLLKIHGGSMYLPWHRWFLDQFEQELGVSLPYWDWSSNSISLWMNEFMGGDGNELGAVVSGPFSGSSGWKLRCGPDAELKRRLMGKQTNVTSLPTLDQIHEALEAHTFESFSQKVERLNSMVNRWVGGSIASKYSPNDPLFYLIHAFVDRLWVMWQRRHPQATPFPQMLLNNLMDYDGRLNTTTPAHVLEHIILSYDYDHLHIAPPQNLSVSETASEADPVPQEVKLSVPENPATPTVPEYTQTPESPETIINKAALLPPRSTFNFERRKAKLPEIPRQFVRRNSAPQTDSLRDTSPLRRPSLPTVHQPRQPELHIEKAADYKMYPDLDTTHPPYLRAVATENSTRRYSPEAPVPPPKPVYMSKSPVNPEPNTYSYNPTPQPQPQQNTSAPPLIASPLLPYQLSYSSQPQMQAPPVHNYQATTMNNDCKYLDMIDHCLSMQNQNHHYPQNYHGQTDYTLAHTSPPYQPPQIFQGASGLFIPPPI